jgi:hypothetical protein
VHKTLHLLGASRDKLVVLSIHLFITIRLSARETICATNFRGCYQEDEGKDTHLKVCIDYD